MSEMIFPTFDKEAIAPGLRVEFGIFNFFPLFLPLCDVSTDDFHPSFRTPGRTIRPIAMQFSPNEPAASPLSYDTTMVLIAYSWPEIFEKTRIIRTS